MIILSVKSYLGRRPGAVGGVIPNSMYLCQKNEKNHQIKIEMPTLESPWSAF